MNVPNHLTLSRIGLTFVMVAFLTFPSIPFGKTLALVTFILAGITDYWDGRLARTSGRVSVFGQLMDPLADKILVCAAFVSFASQRQIVPAWVVIIIISREFLITGLRLLAAQRGQVLPAGRWGKHKMVWQTAAIVVIMLGLALQEDLVGLLPTGHLHAAISAAIDRYFDYVAYTMSAVVCVLTVTTGAIYLWESRAVYMEHI
jgi:CDP-diacylglycerol---glycerol-3-phosphate 3-phosphatidyltransferase